MISLFLQTLRVMYSELENFSKELKWYSAGVYNKEFLVDVSMVTCMESTRAAQNLHVPPRVLMADFGQDRSWVARYVIIF